MPNDGGARFYAVFAGATEIPYGSLEAFGENWKVLYDGEGRLVEW